MAVYLQRYNQYGVLPLDDNNLQHTVCMKNCKLDNLIIGENDKFKAPFCWFNKKGYYVCTYFEILTPPLSPSLHAIRSCTRIVSYLYIIKYGD